MDKDTARDGESLHRLMFKDGSRRDILAVALVDDAGDQTGTPASALPVAGAVTSLPAGENAGDPLFVRSQSSVVHAATPYPAAPIVANGGAADADGSDTAFGVACTMVTVDSDEDVYIANSEAEAEAAADGTAWGRIFHRGGTTKEYPWAAADGTATRAFWAQKISTDATVNVVGWTE